MKVIDLLNKIANGETPPKKIKYDNSICFYDEGKKDYYVDGDLCLCGDYIRFCLDDLNDEVEIIEDKKIEKIDLEDTIQNDTDLGQQCKIINKINEIVDKLNTIDIILTPLEIDKNKCQIIDYLNKEEK